MARRSSADSTSSMFRPISPSPPRGMSRTGGFTRLLSSGHRSIRCAAIRSFGESLKRVGAPRLGAAETTRQIHLLFMLFNPLYLTRGIPADSFPAGGENVIGNKGQFDRQSLTRGDACEIVTCTSP